MSKLVLKNMCPQTVGLAAGYRGSHRCLFYDSSFLMNIVKLRQGSGKVRQGKARKGKDGER